MESTTTRMGVDQRRCRFHEHVERRMGCIARDEGGNVILAVAVSLSGLSKALHVEAVALKHTTRLAEEYAMGRVFLPLTAS